MAVFAELRRRNVFKVALLYIVASWLIVLVVEALRARVELPSWTETFVLFILAVGLPVALWFAWTYEITPAGLKKAVEVDQTQSIVYKTGQKLNAAVTVLLVLGVLAVFGQRLLPKFEFLVPGVPAGDAPTLPATPPEIRSLTLDNGLKIIVWPDHDIPNVAFNTFVRAGSRNEYPGITGVSHFFEHMMFRGTRSRPPGEFDRIMEDGGGANNARTSEDVTVYQDWFPRSALETIMDLEGDRFENLLIEPEAFESERQVVYSERRSSVDDDNFGKLMEQVQGTAFIAHPYQFPVIGWPSDIESWTQQDLVDYYRRYYAPNNRALIVTGDVSAREVFRLAGKYLGSAPARVPPPAIRTEEPKQQGVRRVTVEAPAQSPLMQMAFHMPGEADPRSLGMALLLNILAGGDSSRLHRSLVENEGLLLSVDAYQQEGFDPGLAWLFMSLAPEASVDVVEQRIFEELRKLVNEGPGAAEIEKARNILLADFWRNMATIDGKAAALGRFEVFHGSFEKLFTLPDDLAAITAEELRAIAGEVFDIDNATIGVLSETTTGDAS